MDYLNIVRKVCSFSVMNYKIKFRFDCSSKGAGGFSALFEADMASDPMPSSGNTIVVSRTNRTSLKVMDIIYSGHGAPGIITPALVLSRLLDESYFGFNGSDADAYEAAVKKFFEVQKIDFERNGYMMKYFFKWPTNEVQELALE